MLQALLVSLSKGLRVPDEVIVVDNDPVRSAFPQPIEGLAVRVVHAGLGVSVAGARNEGWRAATSGLCVFIDDDNEVEHGAIAELARAFEPGDVGLDGPVIYSGSLGTIWCAGIRRSRWTGQTHNLLGGRSSLPDAPNWPTEDMPDAFAVPRLVLEELGGFDDRRFPIHYEEADLGVRIRNLGLRAIVVRDAKVFHYGWVGLSPGGALVRATASHGAERARQMALSRIRFHFLHSRARAREHSRALHPRVDPHHVRWMSSDGSVVGGSSCDGTRPLGWRGHGIPGGLPEPHPQLLIARFRRPSEVCGPRASIPVAGDEQSSADPTGGWRYR